MAISTPVTGELRLEPRQVCAQAEVSAAAEAKDWKRVRKLVNGGLNGWAAFAAVLGKLEVL